MIAACAPQKNSDYLIERILRELHPPKRKASMQEIPQLLQRDDLILIIASYEHDPLPFAPLPEESREFLGFLQRRRREQYVPLVLVAPYETNSESRRNHVQHLEEAVKIAFPDLVIVRRNYTGTDVRTVILPPVRKLLGNPLCYKDKPRIVTPGGSVVLEECLQSQRRRVINRMMLLPLEEYFGDKKNYGTEVNPLPGYISMLR